MLYHPRDLDLYIPFVTVWPNVTGRVLELEEIS